MIDPMLSLRLWARSEAARMREEQGLPPIQWRENLPMAVARGVMCIECLKKGHSCQAQIMLEQEDGSHQPFCLPCADSEQCAYERNPPRKIGSDGNTLTPVFDIESTKVRDALQDLAQESISKQILSQEWEIKTQREKLGNPPIRELRIESPSLSMQLTGIPNATVLKQSEKPRKKFFSKAAQHVKTDQHKEWEKAIVEDAGKTPVKTMAKQIGCKEWHVYHYRKLHSIPCSGSSAGSRPRNTEIKQQIAADNGNTPTRTLARDLGVDHKYVKREREKMQEQPKPETNLNDLKKSASYQYVIADLEAKRDELNAVIAGLRAMVQMGELR